ncbi:Peroxin-3 [Pseudoneurospora amorphoporcata]|uniref:Peroxin-3 n=1 Tax=Pseudoneurospora amorphoporcata TaxID=241081 RepID=A0AAN6NVE3_9PEZI|nr:Peroxin-3 [Pseudoneurospora amorphoporcata]
MFASTRRWFKRNRTPLAIGAGVVGAGYVATQYVLRKLNDARERMSSDRIAKENLRRRFEQNQEDCTFTVLALLPTATTNILEALNTERITYEIQQMKSPANRKKSISSLTPSTFSEVGTMDDDGRSMISGFSVQSDGGAYPSFLAPGPLPPVAEGESSAGDASQQEAPKKPRKTKRQLWDDLKISSITRSFTLIYTLGLLTMLTRIQLNLLGRRSYLSSVVSLATGSAREGAIALENNDDDGDLDGDGQAYSSDFEVNRKYLTFSWWLLNRGWVDVMQRVESAVRQVFGPLSPRDTITFDAFSKLTREVRTIIEGSSAGASTQWLPFLLPPQNLEGLVLRESGILLDDPQLSPMPSAPTPEGESTISLRRLLDETADLIESPAFSSVLTQLLDQGFTVLLDNKLTVGAFDTPCLPAAVPPAVTLTPEAAAAGEDVVTSTTLVATSSDLNPQNARQSIDIERPITRAVLLPKILSILTRQAHAIGNGMPNEYLQAMESVRDLEGFAAVVYSSNWQAEIASEEYAGVPAATSASVPSQPSAPRGGKRERPERTVEESAVLMESLGASGPTAGVEESLVVVDPNPDPTAGFDSAWERAMSASQPGSRGPSFEDRR